MFGLLIGLVGVVIGAAIFSLIGALVLMLVAKIVAKAKVGYGKAYGLAFIVSLVGGISTIIVMTVMGIDLMTPDPANQALTATHNIVGYTIGFVVGAWIYGSKITDEGGTAIGFGKGAAISFVLLLIGLALNWTFQYFFGAAMMGGAAG